MPSRLDTRWLRAGLVGAWLGAALLTTLWFAGREAAPAVTEAAWLRAEGRIDEAVQALQRAADTDRRTPDALELLGGLERTRGRLAEAEAAFRHALQQDGHRVEAALGLADVLLARRAPQQAAALLIAVAPERLSTSQRERWLGLLAMSGDAAGLRTAVDVVLAQWPDDGPALRHALSAAERRHDWPRAVEIASRLVEHAGADEADLRLRLARAHDAAGAPREALATYATLDERTTWAPRVRLLSTLNRPREAAELWARYEADPSTPQDRLRRAELWQRAGRFREAERDYAAALRDGVRDDAARVRYAWLLNRERRHREAWAVLAPVAPTRATLEVRAFTAGWASADTAASTLLPQWLATHPRDVSAWTLLAEVSRRRDDADSRTRALTALTRIDGDGSVARAALARHLAAHGSTDAALEAYRTAIDASSAPPVSLLEEYAVLLEQQGRFADALDALTRVSRAGTTRPDLLVREARLRRWAADAAGAVATYRRAIAADPRLAEDATVQADLARALASLAEWDAAVAPLSVALRDARVDEDVLRVAAEVATRRGEHAQAVAYLQQLARRRALTVDERRWLAGQAEEAALWPVALAEYDRLLVMGAVDPLTTWPKVADLEARQGHDAAALAAWRQVPPAARDESYWRRLTWAAARVSREAAMTAYGEAFAAGVVGGEQWLEAARLHASVGDAAGALTWYDRYVTQAPAAGDGLGLEIARTLLAAGRPADALPWIARARTAGQDAREVLALEGEALHLSGRTRDAAERFAALVADPGQTTPVRVGEWFAWLGRSAQARGHLVDATRHFAAALDRGAAPAGELWLARGDIAARRLDLARARQAYAAAQRAGDERAGARLDGLTSARQPTLTLPIEVFTDSNDFTQVGGSARAALRPTDRARVSAEWASARVTQGAVAFTRSAATVAIDRLYPTEQTSLSGQLGIEQARGRTQPLFRVDGAYAFRSRATVSAQAFRESPWRADAWDARMRYNRITDLDAIAGDFHATGAALGTTVPVGEQQEVLANTAMRRFSDGNRQVQAYAQYSVPLSSREQTWVAIQPYVYGERWDRTAAAYFSPERQVTAGATLRAIVTRGPWVVDASATPQYLDSPARSGFGYAAVGSVRRDLGALSVSASGMVFDDVRLNYRVRRMTLDVSVPVGR